MKAKRLLFIFTALLLAACSGGKKAPSTEALLESGDLGAIRERKKELSEKQKELEVQIASLEAFIGADKSNQKLPLVTAFETKPEAFDHFIELQGTVTTKQNVLIYPEMAGTLVRVYVKEGQQVKKGQRLATIDDGGMSSQLAQLKTQLALAETTYERQKRLWDKKIGTEIQYLQAKASYEAQQDIVSQFEDQLSKFQLQAPFSGIIDDVIKTQGTVVAPAGPGSEVFRIINLSNMYIEVSVPETYVADITKGKKVKVHFPVLNRSLESVVRQTGNYINPNNRSFTAEIAVPGLGGLVKPNMTAKVAINDYRNPRAILVPLNVISENADGEQYAYVAVNKNPENIAKATKNIITTGKTQDGQVEVLSGLGAGDFVIVEGARSVKDGQEIQVLTN